MKLTGACFCKEITWEAEIDENMIGICHCRDCQIFSGSAFRLSSSVAPGSFNVTKGTPRIFDKQTDGGNVRRMSFCGTCGTHLCSAPTDTDQEGSFVSVRLASSDQFDQLKPAGEIYCDSRVAWMPPIEGAMQFPKMPG